MYIEYSDHIGVNLVKVNEYGISFDHDKGISIFEDENGNEYRIKFFQIHRITVEE